ncbi:class I SAM-dependent methyltransferase [Streptomyces sp. NRRL F-525]|uniref:class I SAM-dependent methyltransferase n=1 Tax=Streptomyces sp. NRRL F-525 TaxID=1463861 RepID=UPI0005262E69|nr:class I SAM-dependent methyltransferase [Streptomyces sp. NRRL F-525]
MPGTDTTAYAMGNTSGEAVRLDVQDALYAGCTEYLLRAAGLREGMRVLDVGCGTGGVSLAAARIVGPDGHVVGVDMNPEVLEVARGNAAAADIRNVSFEHQVLPDVQLPEPVDALVGRLILMHLADPAAVVKELTGLVRPGGLVTFQEINISRARAIPDVPLVTRCREWICAGQREAGSDPDMGERLAQVLRSAGLAGPAVAVAVPTGDADSTAMTLVAETVRSLLPLIERSGAADGEDVDVETLRGRLSDACAEAGATLYLSELVAAWGRPN